jgi:hypothetical protein
MIKFLNLIIIIKLSPTALDKKNRAVSGTVFCV